jgi:hypothetical protein
MRVIGIDAAQKKRRVGSERVLGMALGGPSRLPITDIVVDLGNIEIADQPLAGRFDPVDLRRRP